MTKIKRFSLALVLPLFVLVLSVPAQTPSIEVSTDNDQVEFAAQGETRRVHVEVFAPSGELVFETADSDGQAIRWGMTNQKGERVADGVYLATMTVVDSLGKKRKRIEQITVSSPQYAAQPTGAPQESLAPTGGGTVGKIAKWLTSSSLGNSVITEGAGKVGVNVAPSATLQVNGLQPAPLANNGTNASVLLQTTGGKGGNTTVSGKAAGAGASISLVAGNGGDGPSGSFGSTPGKGGSITLQPGSGGAALGAGAKSGNVLLSPSGVGLVGVGTTVPASMLHVVSTGTIPPRLQSSATATTSFAAGWDFYHGTVGKGYVGVPGTGVGSPGPGEMLLYGGSGVKTSLWAGGTRGITIATNGNVGIGTTTPTLGKLDVEGGSQYGVAAKSNIIGVLGNSSDGSGVQGTSSSGFGVLGSSSSGRGVYGESPNGYAGYFSGKVQVNGTFINNSDRNAKANIASVNPHSILQRLATIPIQAWNYKAEPASIRHIGPMAQDFRSAFNLGLDDKGISGVDADGVALASIQALYQMMLEKDRQIEQQSSQIQQQGLRIERLEARLNQARRAVRRGRAARR